MEAVYAYSAIGFAQEDASQIEACDGEALLTRHGTRPARPCPCAAVCPGGDDAEVSGLGGLEARRS